MSTYYDQSIQAENERLRRELQDAQMMVAALLATAGGAVRVDQATIASVPRGVEIQRWTDPDGTEVFAIAIESWPPSCPSCGGTGRLVTSGWDDEGFPCPQCSGGTGTAEVLEQ